MHNKKRLIAKLNHNRNGFTAKVMVNVTSTVKWLKRRMHYPCSSIRLIRAAEPLDVCKRVFYIELTLKSLMPDVQEWVTNQKTFALSQLSETPCV